jgi:hypothetical protein
MENKHVSKLFTFSAIVLIVVSIAGCISTNTSQRTFDSIVTTIPLDTEEVIQINFTSVAPQIQEKGYTWRNLSSETSKIEYSATRMHANNLTNYIRPILTINIISISNSSYIWGDYDYENPINESKLTETKQYVLDKMKEVAQICNLTVNWSTAQWTINWSD